jgi:hypothetical protein
MHNGSKKYALLDSGNYAFIPANRIRSKKWYAIRQYMHLYSMHLYSIDCIERVRNPQYSGFLPLNINCSASLLYSMKVAAG